MFNSHKKKVPNENIQFPRIAITPNISESERKALLLDRYKTALVVLLQEKEDHSHWRSWAVLEQFENFKFLGARITNKLEWSKHTKTVVKRAQQSLFPLRKWKRFGIGPQILKRFYGKIESITAWYGNCSASDRKALQRVCTAQYITGAELPAIQDLYTRRCQRKALKNGKDPSHPSHRMFSILPHGSSDANLASLLLDLATFLATFFSNST